MKWKLGALVVAMLLAVALAALIVFTQTKPAITKTVQVTLKVTPKPDIALEVTPMAITSAVGNIVAYSATVTSLKGFAGEIVFSLDGLPAEFTVSYFPANVLTLGPDSPRGVQINITIPENEALVGDYVIDITAESTNYN